MSAPILMLLWEIWRRKCTYVWLCLGAIPSYLLLYWLCLRHVHDPGLLLGCSVPWMLFSLFWVLATFNYTEVNSEKGWTGFPYRLFLLPVPTVVLAWLPMLLGMAAIALVYLAWTRLIFVPLGLNFPRWLWPAGMLAVNLACFQAIVWSLAGFRATRTFVLVLVGFVTLAFDGCALAFCRAAVLGDVPNFMFWKWFFILVPMGLALSALGGSWFSLAWQRRGGGRGRGWFKARVRWLLERLIDAWPVSQKPFASPLAAQFWFEWRCTGVLLPVCVGAVLLLLLGPVSWLNWYANDHVIRSSTVLLVLTLIPFLPVLLAFAVGKGFAKPDFWSVDLALKPFLAVRPLTAGELVVTKMKVAVLSAVLAWLLTLAALPLWFVLWVDHGTVQELREGLSKSGAAVWLKTYYSPFALHTIPVLMVVAAMVLTWRGMVGSLWVGLSGSWRYILSSAVVHGLVAIGLLAGWVYAKVHLSWAQFPTLIEWIGWILAVVVIFKLWLAVFFWDKVSRQHLSSRSVVPWLLAWASGTACLVALAWLICPYVLWLRCLLVLVALWGCPLARLGLAPLSLARNRHR